MISPAPYTTSPHTIIYHLLLILVILFLAFIPLCCSSYLPRLSAQILTVRPIEDGVSKASSSRLSPSLRTSHCPLSSCHPASSFSHFVIFIILVGPPVKSYATRKFATLPALIAAHTIRSVESGVLRASYSLITVLFSTAAAFLVLRFASLARVHARRVCSTYLHIRVSLTLAPSSYTILPT